MGIPKGENRTEAQRRARNKYQAKNEAVLGCKVKKEDAERFKELCKARGTTVSAVLSDFVMEQLNAAGVPGPAGDEQGGEA